MKTGQIAVPTALGAGLLGGRVDYAGLFPPAALSMSEAVTNFEQYQRSTDAWALGRFVVPAARLRECVAAIASLRPAPGVWPLSITLGADPVADLATVDAQPPEVGGLTLRFDCFEARVDSPDAVQRMARAIGARRWYGEVPLGPDQDAILDALLRVGGRAKIRMGGVVPEAFPKADRVAAFLAAVATRDLAFKATAGLHHPVRGRFRLTYHPESPRGVMFGYLNLMVAAALSWQGAEEGLVVAALEAEPPAAFRVEGDQLWWGDRAVDLTRLTNRFDGFGSCSFREPVDELAGAVLS